MADDAEGSGKTLSDHLAATVARLRQEQRLPYTELAERLASLGRPIPVLGLRRIEKGERRVDLDEVHALARALRVKPLALLFPIGRGEVVEVLPGLVVDAWRAAKWHTGEAPFPGEQVEPPGDPHAGPAFAPAPEFGTLAIELHRVHDDRLDEWSQAKQRAALAAMLAGQGPDQEQIRREASAAAERQAFAAEQALGEVRRKMRQHGITPPAITDPRLTHLDEGGKE